jgi:hypothetical protein
LGRVNMKLGCGYYHELGGYFWWSRMSERPYFE